MNSLARHIEALLLEHDCIIVQGLGGFIAVVKPARYMADAGLFYPPYRTVTFNQNLKESDGLLTQLYMQTYDATYPQAVLQVEKDVDDLLRTLDITGEVEIGNIGVLHKNLENRISLTARESGIDSPTLYGLSSIEAHPWAEEEEKEKEENKVEEPVAANPIKKDKEEKTTYRIPFMYDMSVAAAIAAIFFLFFASPMMDSKRETNDVCIAGQGEILKKAIVIQPKNEVKQTEALVVEEVKKDAYTIVLASYVTEKNATSYINKLKREGYEEGRYEDGKVSRIVYGEYASESEARKCLRELRSKHEAFDVAWVMHVK